MLSTTGGHHFSPSPASCAAISSLSSSLVASPTPTMASSSSCSPYPQHHHQQPSPSSCQSFATPTLPAAHHQHPKSPTSAKFELNFPHPAMLRATLLDKFNTTAAALPPPCHSGSMLPFMINEQEEEQDDDDDDDEDELYKNFTTPSFGTKTDLVQATPSMTTTEINPSDSFMNRSCPSYSLNPTTSDILATSLVDFNKKKAAHFLDSNHMAEVLQHSAADIESLFSVPAPWPADAATTLTSTLDNVNVKCYWNNCLKQFAMLSQLVSVILVHNNRLMSITTLSRCCTSSIVTSILSATVRTTTCAAG